jgi:hypothetical protein
MEEFILTQTEEGPTSGLCAGDVGALAIFRFSLLVNGRNGDTPIGYSEE